MSYPQFVDDGPASAGPLSPLTVADATHDLLSHASKDETRFGTGWSLDDACGTVGTGELALMWARSGSGKSTWSLNIVRNTPHVPTMVVNMEMTARRQVEWLCSMTYDLEAPGRDIEEVLRAGEEDPRYGEVTTALEKLSERYPNLHFVNPVRPSIADLSVMLDDIGDATGQRPKRVFIDHLGLCDGCFDYQGYGKFTSGLHSFCMREDVAVYCIQQTGRGGSEAGQKNDGHLPVTLSSGVYTGEQDADWIYGLYRPSRNPKFKRSRHTFADPTDYFAMRDEYLKVANLSILQVIKNRPFGDVNEEGFELLYSSHTRRLEEPG